MNQHFILSELKWQNNRKWLLGAGAVVLVLGAGLLAGQVLPPGIDWDETYRPATLMLLTGYSPYNTSTLQAPFPYAPWAFLPMIPLAPLPPAAGRGIYFVLSLVAMTCAVIRLGARPLATAAFLLSPVVWHCLLNANIDWMPLVGFGLPAPIGLFFVLVKPQMGFVMALFWLAEAWRAGGVKLVVRVFAPVSTAFLLSLLIFGLWPLDMLKARSFTTWWNASLWPASIPVGLVLIVAAFRTRKAGFAMAASPCLSPHVLFHSWSSALIALAPLDAEMIAASLGLWILVIYRAVFPAG